MLNTDIPDETIDDNWVKSVVVQTLHAGHNIYLLEENLVRCIIGVENLSPHKVVRFVVHDAGIVHTNN